MSHPSLTLDISQTAKDSVRFKDLTHER